MGIWESTTMARFLTRSQLHAAGTGIRDAFAAAGILLTVVLGTSSLLPNKNTSDKVNEDHHNNISVQDTINLINNQP